MRQQFVDLTVFLRMQPLGVGVALLALANDRAVKHVQGGKQGGCAVAFVVVRHRLGPSLLQWQAGFRAIECLNLTFLIAAQHQRVLGWGHIQAHDIFELLIELGVARD